MLVVVVVVMMMGGGDGGGAGWLLQPEMMGWGMRREGGWDWEPEDRKWRTYCWWGSHQDKKGNGVMHTGQGSGRSGMVVAQQSV